MKITVNRRKDGWIVINEESETYMAAVLRFKEVSTYGINGGRISKLYIANKRNNLCMANFDRGWDMQPTDEVKEFYNEIINKYN